MTRCMCEFIVESDLVFANQTLKHEITLQSGHEIIFENDPELEGGHAVTLRIMVIGESDFFNSAHIEFRTILAVQLDLLAFVTHSRFKIIRPRRIVEWEPNQKTRKFRVFHYSDSRYPPEPHLNSTLLKSVELLSCASVPDFAYAAMSHFRYGILDEQPEDQFMRIWLALEIIAENSKSKEPVSMVCQACKSPLCCNACDKEQVRVPMAKPQIVRLITSSVGDAASPTIIKGLFDARNGLMHGRSSLSIEKKGKVQMHKLVNKLAEITWKAIISVLPLEHKNFVFAHREGEFCVPYVTAAANGTFECNENIAYPDFADIPDPIATIETHFK